MTWDPCGSAVGDAPAKKSATRDGATFEPELESICTMALKAWNILPTARQCDERKSASV
jgi:hypothetical protein